MGLCKIFHFIKTSPDLGIEFVPQNNLAKTVKSEFQCSEIKNMHKR